MEKTEATLIRLSPYSETSLIVQWCTKDQGLVRTIAKGARRPSSAFAGKLDLFFHAEIAFVRSKRSDLHVLTDVALLDPRLGLRRSYLQTLAASYFVKLVDLVAEPETPINELAELLERALNHLVDHAPALRAITYFERQAAELLGLGKGGIRAIGDLYGRTPSLRAELMRALPREGP